MNNLLLPLLKARDQHERNELLRLLWTVVKRLPPRQRDTLVLLFEDEDGRDLFTVLLEAEIVNWKELAEGMGRSDVEVAGLRKRMPMDPAAVAAELKTSRTNVYRWRFRAAAAVYDAWR